MGQQPPLTRKLAAVPKMPTPTDRPVIARHRGLVVACSLASALLVLLPAVATAAVAGPAPYEALRTSFPWI